MLRYNDNKKITAVVYNEKNFDNTHPRTAKSLKTEITKIYIHIYFQRQEIFILI